MLIVFLLISQRNKDEFLQQVSDAVMQEALDNLANAQSAQNNDTYTTQATNLLQQAINYPGFNYFQFLNY